MGRHVSDPPVRPLRWQLHRQLGPGLDLQREHRIDVYLVWDLLSRHARHGGDQRPGHWHVLLEFASVPAPAALSAWCALQQTASHQTALRAALAASVARAPDSQVHTAVLADALLPLLLAGVSAGALRRFELGAPCAPVDPDEPPQDWPLPPLAGLLNTLGLVAEGCNLAHADLRLADGSSRLLALWDQDPAAGPGATWQRHRVHRGAPAYRYGAELAQPTINRLLASHAHLGERAERQCYADLGRPGWGLAAGQARAAGLLHLLAGPRPLPPAEADARRMPLVVVQLPAAGPTGRVGAAQAVHVVDGARYIVERTRAMAADDGDWCTTVTLPAGPTAGPHDGSSMAELALDQLAADARVRLVVATGDAGLADRHALCAVNQQAAAVLWLKLPPGRRGDTFVQLWLPAGQPAERFQLQLQGPRLPPTPWLQACQAATLALPDALPVAGVVWPQQAAQGLNGHLVLLAIAPTARAPGLAPRPLAAAGLWRIELQAAGNTPATVHAWIDGDNPGDGPGDPTDEFLRGAAPQPRFVTDPAATEGCGPARSHTLCGLANGQRCTLAGGYTVSSRRPSADLAQGPRRGGTLFNPPALCLAPTDASARQPGVAVAGFFSGQRRRLRGSAAAAAQVARWLAEGRLTDDAGRRLQPAPPGAPALPEGTRLIPPTRGG
jgi:hypothetical protein